MSMWIVAKNPQVKCFVFFLATLKSRADDPQKLALEKDDCVDR